MSRMSDFPHNYLETIMRLRVAEAHEVAFAEFISGAVHALQFDKAGKAYSAHPARVVLNVNTNPEYELLSEPQKSAVTAAAWLHDVVEDSGTNGFPAVSLGHLMTRNISIEALEVIELLTRPEDNSSAAKDAYYQGILTNPLALLVKLADIADNLNEHRLALLPAPVQEKARAKYGHALEILVMRPEQKTWFGERILAKPGALTQNCPVCGRWVLSSQRYPRYVCHWCTLSTTDVNGKTISVYNSHILGYGVKVDGVEVESGYPVFVKGVPCTASEAYFGGIVIEPAESGLSLIT
jgi:hypothetical protein